MLTAPAIGNVVLIEGLELTCGPGLGVPAGNFGFGKIASCEVR